MARAHASRCVAPSSRIVRTSRSRDPDPGALIDVVSELVGVGSVLVNELARHLHVDPAVLLQEIGLRIARH